MNPERYTGRPPRPVPRWRIQWREQQLRRFPVADMSKEPKIEPPAPESKAVSKAETIKPWHCKCGARLGRSGKCPALCEPVPEPPPRYTGPKVVGHTHLGRIGAPVNPADPGWIG
jgi:hypothetical protein